MTKDALKTRQDPNFKDEPIEAKRWKNLAFFRDKTTLLSEKTHDSFEGAEAAWKELKRELLAMSPEELQKWIVVGLDGQKRATDYIYSIPIPWEGQ